MKITEYNDEYNDWWTVKEIMANSAVSISTVRRSLAALRAGRDSRLDGAILTARPGNWRLVWLVPPAVAKKFKANRVGVRLT